jgi:hypothetical protein
VSTTERIVITANSSIAELAPAVLTVLAEADATGLDARSASSNSIAKAVQIRFQVTLSDPRRWGERTISQPDFNIELAVSSLVRMGCIRKAQHLRFITKEGQELLKMPLSVIHDSVKAVYDAVRALRQSKDNSERKLENERELENELTAVKSLLEADDLESPSDDDSRIVRLMERVVRIGAVPFRSAVIEAYQGKCAISGSKVIQILQAAHIKPYRGTPTNLIDNALLLRVDIHQLFDKNLIGINPDTRRICLSKELIETEYEKFSGCELAKPVSRAPSRRSLEVRWEEFCKAQNS